MPRPLCHMTSVLRSRWLNLVMLYGKQGVLKIYSDQDAHGTLNRIKRKLTFTVPRFDNENTLAVLPYTEWLEKLSS